MSVLTGRNIALVLSSASLLVACSEDDPAVVFRPPEPGAIEIVSANPQSVAGLATVPQPLIVRVVDGSRRPVRDVQVTWSASPDVVADPAISFTDSAGMASTTVRTGLVFGTTVFVTASSADLPPVRFVLDVGPAPVNSLEITRTPDTLPIGASAPLDVSGATALGPVYLRPGQVQWASSDTALAHITPGGIVTGRGRGTVTITARVADITTSVSLRVTARVRISPFGHQMATLAVNDTIQLKADVVLDIHGNTLPDPQVIWASSHPDVVSVSPTGLVVARHPSYTYEQTVISATTADGVATTTVRVLAASGLVKVRFVHAASSLGPLTFVPSKGTTVTLEYGQSVQRSISPGTLNVSMPGAPKGQYPTWQEFTGFIGEGQGVTLYASGDAKQVFLIPAWDTHPVVRPDRSLVRIVMASSYGESSWWSTVYLVPPGATAAGNDYLEDFFMPAISEYMLRPAEEFDIVKVDTPGEVARLRAKPEAGRAMTFVVTGHSRETMRLLTFIDH